jgi:hypothetical protein
MANELKILETPTADALKVHALTARKRINGFGIAKFKYTEPDFAVLEKAMKSKPGAKTSWTIRFENDKLVAHAQCVGTSLTIAAVDLAKEGDRTTRRKMLEAIGVHSDLADAKDLAAFDKKFPDPVRLAALKAEVDRLRFEIKRDEGFLPTFGNDVLKMDSGRREVSFKRWAQNRAYINFLLFVMAVDDGGDATKVAQDFLADAAPTPIKLTDKTLKAARDALKAGAKPDLKAALAEAAAVVNARLLPDYNKENLAAINKRIADNKKALVAPLTEYKAMGGK